MTIDEILAVIGAGGFGTSGSTLFGGALPPTPDACVAVKEYPGGPPIYFFGEAKPGIEQPRIQILARGAARDYSGPRLLIEQIYQSLAARGAFVQGTARYLDLEPLQPPYELGRDENERWVFGFNLRIWKGLSSTSSTST